MAESPVIRDARERLISAVPSAVETLTDLLDSQADGVRLGAAREILDRGGLPARSDHHVEIEIGLDDEIEQLLRGVARQRAVAADDDQNIEDAIIVDENAGPEPDLLGEQVADPSLVATYEKVGGPATAKAVSDALELDIRAVPEETSDAWWQANPPEEAPL